MRFRLFANSPELFASTCEGLFSKMIDTVPRGYSSRMLSPRCIFIEVEMSDHTGAPIVVEIDVPRPSDPAAANTTYTIWSVPVNSDQPYNMFTIGAEVDWVGKLLGPHLPFAFFRC
ncbi:hypothetical protein B0H13DRAFT_2336260 [Mycena leptocephala]|nr:hypothetical protein B0H13DRAFT_2336260 [Mycena leptocephala]